MKLFWGVVLLVLVIGGGWWYFAQAPAIDDDGLEMQTPIIGGDGVDEMMINGGNDAGMEVGEGDAPAMMDNAITIDAKNFSFSQSEIRVKKGEEITLTLTASEGFHDFVIEELGVSTKRISAGQNDTITFTPDKTGSFAFYCSVGNHRAQGMEGVIVVE